MAEKKRLTQDQEFQIMKLVLDKFLWLGFGIMAWGVVNIFKGMMADGLMLIIGGIIMLILFIWLIVKEYEIIK